MPNHNLLRLRTWPILLNPANIQRPILTREASNTTHVVTVVDELVTREAVLRRVRQRPTLVGQHVQVFAFPAIWTASTCEEEAAVADPGGVGACKPLVFLDVAARLGFYFAGWKLVKVTLLR